MRLRQPLILQELTLSPAEEWSPKSYGWLVVRVSEGMGYCLNAGNARELNYGDGFTIPEKTEILIRSSRLGPMRLQFFEVKPEFLTGLLTLAENRQLKAESGDASRVLFFKADEPVLIKFAKLAEQPRPQQLAIRCAMLELWANSISQLLTTFEPEPIDEKKLRQRFRELIGQMSEAKLAECSLSSLARQLYCSERHLSRLFREEFDTTFRGNRDKAQTSGINLPER